MWLYFSYKGDESYTPSQISVRIGSGYFDLQEIQLVDLREPEGWVQIPLALRETEAEKNLSSAVTLRDKSFGGATDFIRTFCLQIAVTMNHQNGRDSHIRQIKLFGPRLNGACPQLVTANPRFSYSFQVPQVVAMTQIR